MLALQPASSLIGLLGNALNGTHPALSSDMDGRLTTSLSELVKAYSIMLLRDRKMNMR